MSVLLLYHGVFIRYDLDRYCGVDVNITVLYVVEYLSEYFDKTDNKSIMREYIQSLQLLAIYHCSLKEFDQVEAYIFYIINLCLLAAFVRLKYTGRRFCRRRRLLLLV